MDEEVEPDMALMMGSEGLGSLKTLNVHNVSALASLGCEVKLDQVARCFINVELRMDKAHVAVDMHRPGCRVEIYAKGQMKAMGCKTSEEAYFALRKIAHRVRKGLNDPNIKFVNFNVFLISGVVDMGFPIDIRAFSQAVSKVKNYSVRFDPERNPGCKVEVPVKIRNVSQQTQQFGQQEDDVIVHMMVFATGRATVNAKGSPDVLRSGFDCIKPFVERYRRA
eukprot:GDKI01001302.1.p1 GENE.GDKI01001302.1~~GDKI01001302.1.p1  ORF type:complete len:260 (+),score=41.80 GDKI01001302.1:112-780(+)